MNIVFLGGVFEKEKMQEYINKSKAGVQFAANALQWNIIEGLDYWNNKPITIINAPFIGCFPCNYRDLILRQSEWNHVLGAKDINIGFLNFFGIKNIFRAFGLGRSLRQWVNENSQNSVVIAYSAHMPFLWALRKAKILHPQIITCLIVPDLPMYMGLSSDQNWIYKLAKRLDNYLITRLMKYVDSFVLLTEDMAKEMKVGSRKYCVIEGMINPGDAMTTKRVWGLSSNKKSILYTGSLNYRYGIGLLMEAFDLINDEAFELWICGFGEAEKCIVNYSQINSRVKWFGTLNRTDALALQQNATVLVNPRPPNEEFTKFSFPSKNLEYLLSGRPVIGFKLPGIPAEYEDYFFIVENDTPQDLAKKIIEVCNLSPEEQITIGAKAKQFVLNNKNNITQTRKILDLIAVARSSLR